MSNNSNAVGFFEPVLINGRPLSNFAEGYFHFGGILGKLAGNRYTILNTKQKTVVKSPNLRSSPSARIARFVMDIFKLLSFLTVIIPLAMLKIKMDNRKGCQYTVQSKIPIQVVKTSLNPGVEDNQDMSNPKSDLEKSQDAFNRYCSLVDISGLDKPARLLAYKSLIEIIKEYPAYLESVLGNLCKSDDFVFEDFVNVSATCGLTHLTFGMWSMNYGGLLEDYEDSIDNYILDLSIKYPDFLKSLTTLDLMTRNVSSQTFAVLAKSQPKLTFLRLANCLYTTDADLKIIADFSSELEVLDLTNCKKITHSGLAALKCTQLKELKLNYCDQVEDAELITIGNKFSSLESLDLSENGQFSDGAFLFITSKLSQLTDLKLENCGQLTDVAFGRLSAYCPHLKSIHVGGNRRLSDAGLGEIVKDLTGLKKLDISRCDRITDAGLAHILTNCPNLSELNIKGCPLITDSAVQSITTQTHPELRLK